ncbi:MAG: HAD-IA family hydrolase [Betaproteobacteria bacterium]|nr:HAD-IA family hydrolase [Betaproteobacteria bacterium]
MRAVIWDFGGVFTSSPFDAFRRYETTHGLPEGFLRHVNTQSPDTNAWARLERAEITAAEFDAAFAEESAALGHRVPGADVVRLLFGEVRPVMVEALRRCRRVLRTACITNNFGDLGPEIVSEARARAWREIAELFEFVLESSKVGVRKPEPAIYLMACERLGVAPEEAVFVDDLGINLKPARALGMKTVKVGSPEQALRELEALAGFALS